MTQEINVPWLILGLPVQVIQSTNGQSMSILSDVREFPPKGLPKQLEVLLLISKENDLRKLGKVVQRSNQLLSIPSMPLGLHMSVHDADADHPMARIHLKIPRGKGSFMVWPPGSNPGNCVGEVDIPPFSHITGVLRLPPEPSVPSLTSAESFWQQSPPLKLPETRSKFKVTIELHPPVSGIGIDYFFVEPDNLMKLVDWYDKRASMYSGVKLAAYAFKFFVPWMAIVTMSGELGHLGAVADN